MATPTDIPGLYAWYKASTFSLVEGDTCGNWIDSSGNGRTMTVTVNAGFPKYRANQIAGFPAIQNNASSYFINTSFDPGGSQTIFIAWKGDVLNNAPILGGNSNESLLHLNTGVIQSRADNGGIISVDASGTLSAGVWAYAHKFQTSWSQMGVSLNGNSEATVALSGSRAANTQYYLHGNVGALTQCTIAEVIFYSASLSGGDKTLIDNYLRDKYFGTAPGQQEQMRDAMSRRLWLRRRPGGLYTVTGPLWILDADILDRIAAELQTGPAPAAAGWGGKKWQRRAFSVQSIEPDAATNTVTLTLLDRRPLDILLWDSSRTDLRNSGARQSGVARLTRGIDFTFTRLSQAWIENPADPTAVVACAQTERAVNQKGEYLEEARTNECLRSSFVSGTTGLTLAGTGTNGSAIAVDTSDLFFDSGTTPNSLKFTAGSPHAAELRATFPATASMSSVSVRVTIDHVTNNGERLYWRLQRSVDSWFWNDGSGAWQSGSVDNQCAASTSRNPDNRTISKAIAVGAGATTLTLSVLFQTGGTASRISHLYHVQIEKGSFPTSRVVTDGAAVQRVATVLKQDATTALKLYDPALGGFWCEFVPDWSSSELGSTEDMYLFYMETNGGADRQALYYDASAGAFVFESKVGGSTVTASKTATVTRGTAVKVGARWTGADGELGLTNYTVSVFVDGVKGTDATSAAPTFTSPETLWRGSDGAGAKQANGAVRGWRVLPYAPTDEEMAAFP